MMMVSRRRGDGSSAPAVSTLLVLLFCCCVLFARPAAASVGDRLPEFRDCVQVSSPSFEGMVSGGGEEIRKGRGG